MFRAHGDPSPRNHPSLEAMVSIPKTAFKSAEDTLGTTAMPTRMGAGGAGCREWGGLVEGVYPH